MKASTTTMHVLREGSLETSPNTIGRAEGDKVASSTAHTSLHRFFLSDKRQVVAEIGWKEDRSQLSEEEAAFFRNLVKRNILTQLSTAQANIFRTGTNDE